MNTHVSTQVSKLLGMEMTIQEAALHLDVSVNTIRRRLTTGLLVGKKVANRWVINIMTTTENPEIEFRPSRSVRETHYQAEIDWLKELLEAQRIDLASRTKEISELHQLLAAHSLNAGQRKSWWAFWR